MLKRDKLRKEKKGKILKTDLQIAMYRPFTLKKFCYNYTLIDVGSTFKNIFINNSSENIHFSINNSGYPFYTLISKYYVDKGFTGDSFCFSLYKYSEDNKKTENITDWALQQFRKNYELGIMNYEITKEDIFYYIYAVLHNPNYRQKYEIELKRLYPRIPFYKDFTNIAKLGKQLADLHLNFETAEPYKLGIKNYELGIKIPKPKLKLNKETNEIYIDDNTTLQNVPEKAYQYILGSRTAIEWILDQYKEKEIGDLTIAEKFNVYKFADYKEIVIDLLKRICTVSVLTVEIMEKLKNME